MINRIKAALAETGIETYIIHEASVETAELFFVRTALDTRRIKRKQARAVTVYRDFEENGELMRGSTDVSIYPGMSDAEIKKALEDAYFAARCVRNKHFELPEPCVREHVDYLGDFAEGTCADHARVAANAIFAVDGGDAFINSAEIFVRRKTVRIITSLGTDVSYSSGLLSGEYVVQCKTPEDVELHRSFALDKPDCAQLSEQVLEALTTVRDRAKAAEAPDGGEYDVIISDNNAARLLSFYAERASANMIYPGYSSYTVGCSVQDKNAPGEKLNLSLLPDSPYSGDGIPMTERELVRDGKLMCIFGSTRFCRYLGIEPTGLYSKLGCSNGESSFEQMKSGRCLQVVDFSDMQVDSMSGHFGGEIRLAYLHEGGKTTILTGGSISGNLFSCGSLVFSKERYSEKSYDGPRYILIPGVSVAGK